MFNRFYVLSYCKAPLAELLCKRRHGSSVMMMMMMNHVYICLTVEEIH